jgi:hypothetical protein
MVGTWNFWLNQVIVCGCWGSKEVPQLYGQQQWYEVLTQEEGVGHLLVEL